MRDGALHGLDQLIDDSLWRCPVGVAHAEIDDVFTALAGGILQLRRDVEHVGRQALDSGEFFHVTWICATQFQPAGEFCPRLAGAAGSSIAEASGSTVNVSSTYL